MSDYRLDWMQDVESFMFHTGLLAQDSLLDSSDRMTLLGNFRAKQEMDSLRLETLVQNIMVLDPEDSVYGRSRKLSKLGCQIAPIAIAGYKIGKNAINTSRAAKSVAKYSYPNNVTEFERHKAFFSSISFVPLIKPEAKRAKTKRKTVINGSTFICLY
ncbi:MAG: hypothetical protein SNF33_00285 (plasmid) [Candidatus Algichlamydia australiensis]|nr:hypothetical protein [Chlamydiales bacterium]